MLTEPRLVSSRFPSRRRRAGGAVRGAHPRGARRICREKRVPLATIVMSLRQQAEKPPEVALDNTPPRIFVSARPASLVVFDGEPVLAPIAGTTLSFAVNTNWDVFTDSATQDVVPAQQRRLAHRAGREGPVDAGGRAAAVVRGAAGRRATSPT